MFFAQATNAVALSETKMVQCGVLQVFESSPLSGCIASQLIRLLSITMVDKAQRGTLRRHYEPAEDHRVLPVVGQRHVKLRGTVRVVS
jgi:hypothetical protein